MDCSLPGSSIHGIFRATVLEWGAIAFFPAIHAAAAAKLLQSCPIKISNKSQIAIFWDK